VRTLQIPLLRVNGMLGRCYLRQHRWPEAIAAAEANLKAGGASAQATLGYTLGRAGQAARARTVLSSVLERSQMAGADPINVALVYAGLGENDQAFRWVEKSLAVESLNAAWGPLDLIFDALAGDPRVDQYRHRVVELQKR
jgi:tetratricopeptide (TPR) repeat protein